MCPLCTMCPPYLMWDSKDNPIDSYVYMVCVHLIPHGIGSLENSLDSYAFTVHYVSIWDIMDNPTDPRVSTLHYRSILFHLV